MAEWQLATTANWTGASSWDIAPSWPNAIGAVANFQLNVNTGNGTNVNGNFTIGSSTISDALTSTNVRRFGSTGILTFNNSPSTPVINLGSSCAIYGNPVAGTSGINITTGFNGSGGLTFSSTGGGINVCYFTTGSASTTTTSNTITGTISVSQTGLSGISGWAAGGMGMGSPANGASNWPLPSGSTAKVFPDATNVSVATKTWVFMSHAGAAATINNTFSGQGIVAVTYYPAAGTGSGLTFAAGKLAGLTGTGSFTSPTTGWLEPTAGLVLTNIPRNTDGANKTTAYIATAGCSVVVNDFPSQVWYYVTTPTAATAQTVSYTGAVATQQVSGGFNVHAIDTTNIATSTFRLNANHAGANPLLISGGISMTSAGTPSFYLGGTNTQRNNISGTITGNMNYTKDGAGTWVLSGANTFNTLLTVSTGVLAAESAQAFGTSAAGNVTQNAGAIIEINGGITLNKANRTFTLNTGGLRTLNGTNQLNCGGITLSATTPLNASAGAYLKLNNTGAMSGVNFGITKTGAGEIDLGTFANTYTGPVTISAGTLTVGVLANLNSNSSLGTGVTISTIALTGTLKYAGTVVGGHSTNRSLIFTGSAPALEASGTGPVTFSAATTGSVTAGGTVTFKGTNIGANTLSAALANGAGALNVAKDGTGKWVLSGALSYTGTTTVIDGTLEVQATNSNTTTGAVTVAASKQLNLVTSADPGASTANGKVMGNSNVAVSGTLKTRTTGSQAGKVRFGLGGLTLNSGAQLYVGGA